MNSFPTQQLTIFFYYNQCVESQAQTPYFAKEFLGGLCVRSFFKLCPHQHNQSHSSASWLELAHCSHGRKQHSGEQKF